MVCLVSGSNLAEQGFDVVATFRYLATFVSVLMLARISKRRAKMTLLAKQVFLELVLAG
jgi:hypothetical protein